ncbi:MAG: NUDIX domain-containing protein [Candidatus Sungbacteria bacterium]|uniref:NUDIX domain-containing protein n=1 Tax=Candidatus Sungiibacteriota bacterium TaxID=2750080 RepID=A0A932VPC2_9BACT|nr:NUDIX domain-containing protein [Candidatus Sungbacteria bacterium]
MAEKEGLFDTAKVLLQTEWEEGKVFPIVRVPYRFRVMGVCSGAGRQTAQFANGAFPYFEHMEITRLDGSWASQGNAIVPVLPDDRLLMVVEQRPPQYRFPDQPTHIELDSGRMPLAEFGPYSVVEFPGGGVERGEIFTAGFLRELMEETGIPEQSAMLYWCSRPHHPLVCDLADEKHVGVIYLSEGQFGRHVQTDGGLHVLALEREEIQKNIWNGVIRSVHAAQFPFAFYKEVEDASVQDLLKMQEAGYVAIRRVMIRR